MEVRYTGDNTLYTFRPVEGGDRVYAVYHSGESRIIVSNHDEMNLDFIRTLRKLRNATGGIFPDAGCVQQNIRLYQIGATD